MRAIQASNDIRLYMNNNWIPISDRFPDEEVDVLVCSNGIVAVARFCTHYDGEKYWGCSKTISGYDCDLDLDEKLITHWMPLPDAF